MIKSYIGLFTRLSAFCVLSGLIMFSSCNSQEENEIRVLKLKVHTFNNDEIVSKLPYYHDDLKDLVMPITERTVGKSILISKIDFSDKVNSKWKASIDIEKLSKQIGVSFNIKMSSNILGRVFEPTDEGIPAETHMLYKKSNGILDMSSTEFDYAPYYEEKYNDTSIGFFVWSNDKEERSKNIYSELKELRNAIAEYSDDFPWRTVVVAYKPKLLPADILEEPQESVQDTLVLVEEKDPPPAKLKEICDNGKDDDNDGKVDCKDSGCEPCKEKCLIIYNNKNSFSWTDMGPGWTYSYAFSKGNFNSTSKSAITSLSLPKGLPTGVRLTLKVSAYKGSSVPLTNEYKFMIYADDNYIIVGDYCPDGLIKQQNCKTN